MGGKQGFDFRVIFRDGFEWVYQVSRVCGLDEVQNGFDESEREIWG